MGAGATSTLPKFDLFFSYFSQKTVLFHISYNGDNLHEMSNPVFWKQNVKNISKCHLLKLLPSMLS